MKPKKKLIAVLVFIAVLSTIWLVANPPGRLGWCCYAYSTFGACPRPISDFQVRSDGSTRNVAKTHYLTLEKIEWLLDLKTEVLIIARVWDGITNPDDRVRELKDCEIHLLKNKEAIELFNRL